MKTVLWYALLFLAPLMSLCQPTIPDYGKIDKADLLMTDCDFDAGASAFKLLDYGRVRFERGYRGNDANPNDLNLKVVTERRVRIKILKREGFDYANVKVPIYAKDERVKKIEACTYTLNDQGGIVVSKVEEDGIFVGKTNNYFNQLTIVLPNIQVGSVIEYKYTIETEDDSYIRDWYFQGEIPVRLSHYDIDIPMSHGFGEEKFINHPLAKASYRQFNEKYYIGVVSVTVPTVNGILYLWNVPSLKKEAYVNNTKDYLQRVYYHTVAKQGTGSGKKDSLTLWRDLAIWLGEKKDLDNHITDKITGSDSLITQVAGLNSTKEKSKTILAFVKKYFSILEEGGILPSTKMDKVWANRSGSAADVNLLFINLLNKAGIMARPFLGSTRQNGMVNMKYPSLRQFDQLLTYIPIDNRYFLLNAADKMAIQGLPPQDLLGTKGLVLDGEKSFFVEVKDSGVSYKQVVNAAIEINNQGSHLQANGNAIINSYGYAKSARINAWQKSKDAFIATYLSHAQFSYKIDSITLKNETDDALPVEQQLTFTMPVNTTGSYAYLNTNIFTGLTTNPFIEEERVFDIDFGYTQSWALNVFVKIPDGFALESLPKSVYIVLPDKSLECKRVVTETDGEISVKIWIDCNKPIYSATQYSLIKNFYKQLFDLLEEQIVFKKQ